MHVSEYTRPLVENISFIDGVIGFGEDLANHHFDTVVDLMAKFSTARHYAANNFPRKIGNAARWFSFLYDDRAVVRRSYARMNEAEYNWRLMQLIDSKLVDTQLQESLTLEDFKNVKPYAHTTPYIVLMPGVSVSAKPWPEYQWEKLGEILSNEDQDRDVIYLGGPAESELLDRLQSKLIARKNVKFEKLADFPTLLGILKNASGFVGPSTGITHLASAANCRGIAIYPSVKSMHPRRWQPFNSSLKVKTLTPNLDAKDIALALQIEMKKSNLGKYRDPISAFIICFNEEQKIERALKSISWCDEIIVIDSGSTDRTREIALRYTKNVINRAWPGHVAQKQFGLSQCSHDWVLNIDADEEVSSALRTSIESVLNESTPAIERFAGFRISRIVRFLGRWWDHCGWYPEYRLRFVRKSRTTWGGLDPHEKATVTGRVGTLKGDLYHYTYSSMADQINRLNRFSTHSAESLKQQGVSFNLFNLVANPIFRFCKFYFIKRGFLEGKAGFIVAVYEALSTFLKYAKLWELTDPKVQSDSLDKKPLTLESKADLKSNTATTPPVAHNS